MDKWGNYLANPYALTWKYKEKTKVNTESSRNWQKQMKNKERNKLSTGK